MGRVHTCFSVTPLCGAGFCEELTRATNRSRPLRFGKTGGEWGGLQGSAHEGEGCSSTQSLPETFLKDGSILLEHHPALPTLPPEPHICLYTNQHQPKPRPWFP